MCELTFFVRICKAIHPDFIASCGCAYGRYCLEQRVASSVNADQPPACAFCDEVVDIDLLSWLSTPHLEIEADPAFDADYQAVQICRRRHVSSSSESPSPSSSDDEEVSDSFLDRYRKAACLSQEAWRCPAYGNAIRDRFR